MTAPASGGLPGFVVIGTQKGGTSSLFHYLRHHPDVFLHERKELSFFTHPAVVHHPDRYRAFFADARPGQVCGDVSPAYAMYPLFDGAEAMAQLVPDARLVYLVRHPIERMISGYLHDLAEGRRNRSLIEELNNGVHHQTSRYGLQLAQFRRWYSADQILVVDSSDLQADRAATLARICLHIGVDPGRLPSEPMRAEHHRTADKAIPRPWLRGSAVAPLAIRASTAWPALAPFALRTARPGEFAVDEGELEWVRKGLVPDLRWFRELVPGHHCWGLLDDASPNPAVPNPAEGVPDAGANVGGPYRGQ